MKDPEPLFPLFKERFGAKCVVIWHDGVPDRREPAFLSWPMVRGDEFGPPIQSAAELAKASKGKRR